MTTSTDEATATEIYETVAPADLKRQRRYVSSRATALVSVVAFLAIVTWGWWLGVDGDQLTWLCGILLFVLAVIGFAVLSSVRQEAKQSEPYQISFDGDRVRFERGQNWIHAPIGEMKWFNGKMNEARASRELPLRQKCLILIFPTGYSAACGLTTETHDHRRRVLDDSECPCLVNLEGFQGILLGLVQIALTVAGGYLGYQMGVRMEQTIIALNWLPALGASFPPCLCISGIWLGFVLLPLTVTGWRRNTADERHRWLGATIAIPCKFGVPLLMGPPPATLTVLISVITVTSLIAMTFVLFCSGPSLTERGCESNFEG